jgi:XTP/dITP diphosphohydrolase
VATRNAGKKREFDRLLAGPGIELEDLNQHPSVPEVEETGDSYLANALLKARQIARHTGLPALADDSGLEVDALGGAPGVHSARFAGSRPDGDNIALLLTRLQSVSEQERTARFRCVLVVAKPDGSHISAEGTCEGRITTAPRGRGGFGYDPVFFYAPAACTFAELDAAEKNRVSHRANACTELRAKIAPFLRASS